MEAFGLLTRIQLPKSVVITMTVQSGQAAPVSYTHLILGRKSGKFSYISKFHIIISCKLIVYIVMCFYQETN